MTQGPGDYKPSRRDMLRPVEYVGGSAIAAIFTGVITLVVTRDFKLARFDPATGKLEYLELDSNGKPVGTAGDKLGPACWALTDDARTAYLIRMSDSRLFRIDLANDGEQIPVADLGRMIEGKTVAAARVSQAAPVRAKGGRLAGRPERDTAVVAAQQPEPGRKPLAAYLAHLEPGAAHEQPDHGPDCTRRQECPRRG